MKGKKKKIVSYGLLPEPFAQSLSLPSESSSESALSLTMRPKTRSLLSSPSLSLSNLSTSLWEIESLSVSSAHSFPFPPDLVLRVDLCLFGGGLSRSESESCCGAVGRFCDFADFDDIASELELEQAGMAGGRDNFLDFVLVLEEAKGFECEVELELVLEQVGVAGGRDTFFEIVLLVLELEEAIDFKRAG
jgi:hypothetical protein